MVIPVAAGDYPDRYRCDRLRLLSEAMRLTSLTDTLSDGFYYGTYSWEGRPLSITVVNGEVSHIGLQLFTQSERDIFTTSPVYDFIERYALEDRAPWVRPEFPPDMQPTEEIIIEKGRLGNLQRVLGDSTLVFSASLYDGRKYTIEWENESKCVFRMSFPASYRLLGGYVFDEATRRLPDRIAKSDAGIRPDTDVNEELFEECDSLLGYYHVLKGDFCVLPIVNNDRYYFLNDTTASLLFTPAYPVESLSNLLVTASIDNSYTACVRMAMYERKTRNFEVPLNALINYFIGEGCRPFFGLKGVYPERDKITALYEMVNTDAGYEHLMSVTYDTKTLPGRGGEIHIKLTPYLPTHDIRSLFAN